MYFYFYFILCTGTFKTITFEMLHAAGCCASHPSHSSQQQQTQIATSINLQQRKTTSNRLQLTIFLFQIMDLLKQELIKKRKAIELAKNSSEVGKIGDNQNDSSGKRYLKAADVRRFQEKQMEQEEERRRKLSQQTTSINNHNQDNKKRKCNDERDQEVDGSANEHGSSTNKVISKSMTSSSKTNIRSTKESSESNNGDVNKVKYNDKDILMTSLEITQALRELGIPVWLFGEQNDSQRLDRLKEAKENRKVAMAGLSEMDEYRLGSGHGIRNPFIGKNKDDDLDLKPKHDNDDSKHKKKSLSQQQQQEEEESDDPHKAIHSFFKNLLRQWEDDLAHRPDSIKRTVAGKNETKTLKQCRDYIRPLFKLCKNRTIEENIMGSLLKIVNFCKEGEFVRANDVYMDVAIGRAAWPIGVTMVGIHQRTGRERINADKVAHVMNSELQRKYLTSVKRLITYCQKKRPDVDPSKKVTNV